MPKTLNIEKLNVKFATLTKSKESIQGLAAWIMHHKEFCGEIAQEWLLGLSKDYNALTMFYVANDVIQNCGKKKVPEFREAFSQVLDKAISLEKVKEIKQDVTRLFEIWMMRDILDRKLLLKLKEELNDHPERLSQTPSSQSEVEELSESEIIANYNLGKLVKSVKNLKLLEDKQKEKEEILKYAEEPEVGRLNEIMVRSDGEKSLRKCNEYSHVVKECLKLAQNELTARKALLKELEKSCIYYTAQSSDVKKVALAYQTYGKRLTNVEKNLNKKRAESSSLIDPSPEISDCTNDNSSTPMSLGNDENSSNGSNTDSSASTPLESHSSSFKKRKTKSNFSFVKHSKNENTDDLTDRIETKSENSDSKPKFSKLAELFTEVQQGSAQHQTVTTNTELNREHYRLPDKEKVAEEEMAISGDVIDDAPQDEKAVKSSNNQEATDDIDLLLDADYENKKVQSSSNVKRKISLSLNLKAKKACPESFLPDQEGSLGLDLQSNSKITEVKTPTKNKVELPSDTSGQSTRKSLDRKQPREYKENLLSDDKGLSAVKISKDSLTQEDVTEVVNENKICEVNIKSSNSEILSDIKKRSSSTDLKKKAPQETEIETVKIKVEKDIESETSVYKCMDKSTSNDIKGDKLSDSFNRSTISKPDKRKTIELSSTTQEKCGKNVMKTKEKVVNPSTQHLQREKESTASVLQLEETELHGISHNSGASLVSDIVPKFNTDDKFPTVVDDPTDSTMQTEDSNMVEHDGIIFNPTDTFVGTSLSSLVTNLSTDFLKVVFRKNLSPEIKTKDQSSTINSLEQDNSKDSLNDANQNFSLKENSKDDLLKSMSSTLSSSISQKDISESKEINYSKFDSENEKSHLKNIKLNDTEISLAKSETKQLSKSDTMHADNAAHEMDVDTAYSGTSNSTILQGEINPILPGVLKVEKPERSSIDDTKTGVLLALQTVLSSIIKKKNSILNSESFLIRKEEKPMPLEDCMKLYHALHIAKYNNGISCALVLSKMEAEESMASSGPNEIVLETNIRDNFEVVDMECDSDGS